MFCLHNIEVLRKKLTFCIFEIDDPGKTINIIQKIRLIESDYMNIFEMKKKTTIIDRSRIKLYFYINRTI